MTRQFMWQTVQLVVRIKVHLYFHHRLLNWIHPVVCVYATAASFGPIHYTGPHVKRGVIGGTYLNTRATCTAHKQKAHPPCATREWSIPSCRGAIVVEANVVSICKASFANMG